MTDTAKTVWRLGIYAPLLAVLVTQSPAQGKKNLVWQSSVIFQGRVMQLDGTTMAAVPPSSEMVVVEIERVLDKPASISIQTRGPVTIKLIQPGSLRPGDRAVFYTNGRIFGEGVALEEVGHEVVAQQQTATPPGDALGVGPADRTARDDVDPIRQQLSEETLQERIRSAAVVAGGRVREVREPTGEAVRQGPTGGLRISEHDPMIAEAVIEVTDGIKGARAGSDIVIRFPTSQDVMWYTYPKFHVGQTGVFILQPDTLTEGAPAVQRGTQVPAFNVLQPNDVLPLTDMDRVRNLVR
jgi:hypothetical protein